MSVIRLAVTENVLSDPSRVTLQMYRDYLDLLGRGWVCEAHGKVVGFSYAATQDASIWALFIDQAYEGCGIGSRLLDLACAWLAQIGKPTVTLSTTADTRADRFYRARGWQRGTPNQHGDVHFTRTFSLEQGQGAL